MGSKQVNISAPKNGREVHLVLLVRFFNIVFTNECTILKFSMLVILLEDTHNGRRFKTTITEVDLKLLVCLCQDPARRV